MSRVKLHDAEIGQVNARAPSGVSDRIQTIELKARGLQPEIEIAKQLRLPSFDRQGGPLLAWPPHERSLAEQMAAIGGFAAPEYNWRNWPAELEKRERQKEIDNDAMKDFYQQRERERAEREKIAIEKAKEDDRQAYRERG
jgi:hypothetical protein